MFHSKEHEKIMGIYGGNYQSDILVYKSLHAKARKISHRKLKFS